jgi:hypothetical protein
VTEENCQRRQLHDNDLMARCGTGPGDAWASTEDIDLAARRPWQLAREAASVARREAPVRSVLARFIRVHTEERAWRIGADGEEKVGDQLEKLVRQDPRWRVLHSTPVGAKGADVDHLVIGPGGVFTLNAKHHPGARVWVGGDTLMVNGARQPYVRNSRHEALRASRLLTSACGWPVRAAGVIVLVNAENLKIKVPASDVQVVGRRKVLGWLRRREQVLDAGTVAAIFGAACTWSTWR